MNRKTEPKNEVKNEAERREIRNKTPHDVNIVDENGKVVKTFPRSKNSIRLDSETKRVGEIEVDDTFIPLSKTVMGDANLPEKRDDVLYIVSRIVQESFPERYDFIIPNEIVRDDEGKIVGCKSLAVLRTKDVIK